MNIEYIAERQRMRRMPTALLAVADQQLRDDCHWLFSHHGIDVHCAADALDCLAKLRRFVPSLLILDIELHWGGGDGVLDVMRADPHLRSIWVVLTATAGSAHILEQCLAPPVVRVLTRPYSLAALIALVPHLSVQHWLNQRSENDRGRMNPAATLVS